MATPSGVLILSAKVLSRPATASAALPLTVRNRCGGARRPGGCQGRPQQVVPTAARLPPAHRCGPGCRHEAGSPRPWRHLRGPPSPCAPGARRLARGEQQLGQKQMRGCQPGLAGQQSFKDLDACRGVVARGPGVDGRPRQHVVGDIVRARRRADQGHASAQAAGSAAWPASEVASFRVAQPSSGSCFEASAATPRPRRCGRSPHKTESPRPAPPGRRANAGPRPGSTRRRGAGRRQPGSDCAASSSGRSVLTWVRICSTAAAASFTRFCPTKNIRS